MRVGRVREVSSQVTDTQASPPTHVSEAASISAASLWKALGDRTAWVRPWGDTERKK